MGKGRKIKTAVWAAIIILTLAFIWGNSAIGKEESSSESGKIYGFFAGILNAVFGEGVITHGIFRKIAHFSEYALLAVEVYMLIRLIFEIKPLIILNFLQVGLYVAVADEGIQILSERGPAVQDVLLDFCGFSFGAVVFTLIFYIVKAIKRNKLRNKKGDKI